MVQSLLAPGLVQAVPGMKAVIWRSEAALLGLFWAVCRRLPPEQASALGGRIARWLGPKLRKQRHVLRNLSFVLPEADPGRLEEVSRGMWDNIGRVVAEFAFLERFQEEGFRHRIEVVDQGGLEAARSRPGALFVGGHLANWYLTLFTFHSAGIEGSVVYSPLRNPYMEARFAERRRHLPVRFLTVAEASRFMLRELRAGRSVGLLCDQRYDRGEWVPFFGVPARTAIVPARIALKLEVPLVPVRIERLGGLRFRITVHAPEAVPSGGGEEERARLLAERINRRFETWIRERPEQWLCVKRRFPKSAVPGRAGNRPA